MKRVSVPWAPTSTRAMMRSTRLQLAAPSKNSLKRRTFFVFADASKRTSVLVSRSATCLRSVVVGRQDEVDFVGAAPIDDRWTAIMSVGPDQDPCSASCTGSPAPGSAGGGGSQPRSVAWPAEEKNRTDEPAIAIEHHDRLEAVFVVMGVEQAQLLAAMHGIKGQRSSGTLAAKLRIRCEPGSADAPSACFGKSRTSFSLNYRTVISVIRGQRFR